MTNNTLTLDETIKLEETPLNEPASYYIELSLGMKVESSYKPGMLKAILDEPRVKKLILELLEEEEVEAEILSADLIEFEEWDEL